MINKKTYFSISEVSRLSGIQEHTIRFWDSKLPGLSKQSEKGKTRFFNQQQINKLLNINNLLKNNDSLSLAYLITSINKFKNNSLDFNDFKEIDSDHSENTSKITKIKSIINNLKKLLN